jgi:DNA polymerase III epsilon subunit-like protein
MKVLVFDTETTGLPAGRNLSIRDVGKWPHIIQLSYILYDTEQNNTITCIDDIIKLDSDVNISKKSIEMHGITRSVSSRKGIDIKDAIDKFNSVIQKTDIIIAHNLSFDKQMIMVECNRLKTKQYFTYGNGYGIKEYCTMRNSVNICKIEKQNAFGNTYHKFPTLSELHEHLFDFIPNNTHDSMSDVLICLRCYYVLVNDDDVISNGCPIIKNLYNLYCN